MNEKALVGRVCELIDIPSVSRDEAALLAHITSLMPAKFKPVYQGDAVTVFATPPRSNTPLVVIAGHTDTVPIANNVPSVQRDNVIYGRGACDMKAALAVMLELARWLADDGRVNDLPFDLAFLFFGREELPSDESALLPALGECELLHSASFAILMEPTNNALELGCQGNLNLTVTFTGTAAHTARPWTGSNAAHTAITQLQTLAVAQPHDVDIDGLQFREVANVTAIRGGVARNVLPDSIEVDVNVRYAPNRRADEVATMWQQQLASEHARVTVVSNAPPAPVVFDHELVRALLHAGAGDPMPKQAWTNAADFALYGVPAINFGPGDPAFAHKDDEQVEISAVTQSFAVLQRFLAGGGSA